MRRVLPALLLAVLPVLVPTAQADAVPGCLLLALDVPPGPAVDLALRQAGVSVSERFPVADTVLACGQPAALAAASRLPVVARAVPEEPLVPHLADARRLVDADLGLGPAGALPGDGVAIALVDSAVDASHPGLRDAVSLRVKFAATGEVVNAPDADAHGTHVAGILAGSGAASTGERLHGLAPGATLVGLDISDAFTTTNALRAFEWIHENHAAQGIRVVSNSWGREREDARWDPEDPVVRASSALVSDGLVVVFSAGNRGGERGTVTLEAMNPDVLAVGATGKDGDVEPYSSRGPPLDASGRELGWQKPDLVAAGTRIASTKVGGGYVLMNGTSMAAPQVAAAAAVLLAARPDLPPDAVAMILRETAADHGAPGADPAYGHGLLDVAAALRAATELQAERVVVREEVRTPVRASGIALSAAGRFLGAGDVLSESIRVPVGGIDAKRVDLVLAWDSLSAAPTAWLTDGEARLGPYEGTRGRIVVRAALPAGGPWLLEVRAGDLPDRAEWALDGYVASLVEREVTSAGEARAWAAAARASDGFFEEHARGGALRNVVGPFAATTNLGIAGGLGACAFTVGRWRRKGP